MDKGFVYAVSDPMWMAETVRSANSCRKVMPDLAIELYATPDIVSSLDRRAKKLFDKVVSLDPPTFINRPRFDAMRLSKLQRAVFIDSDTYFVKPVYEIFDALDNYDIAACVDQQHIHGEYTKSGLDKILPPISDAISEWNSGVFVVKKCEATSAFIDRWIELFTLCWENDFFMDQASMRVAISQSGVRVAPLPMRYNFRALRPQVIRGEMYINHAHGDLKKIAEDINKNKKMRIYDPDPALIYGFKPKGYDPAKHKLAGISSKS